MSIWSSILMWIGIEKYLCACIYLHMRTHTCIYQYIWCVYLIYLYKSVDVQSHTHTLTHTHTHTHTHIYIYIYVCMYKHVLAKVISICPFLDVCIHAEFHYISMYLCRLLFLDDYIYVFRKCLYVVVKCKPLLNVTPSINCFLRT